MRVYLIDGFSLLYRAFYALPQSIVTSSGLPANALYGFTSMILKLLDTEEEVGIGVVWGRREAGFPVGDLPGVQGAEERHAGGAQGPAGTPG